MQMKLRLGLMTGAAVAIFVAVSGSSFFSVANLIEDQTYLSHSHEVVGEFHNMLFRMSASAAKERTYLLTGSKDILDDYHDQVKQAFSSITKMKDMVKNNPVQMATMNELSILLERRLRDFDTTLNLSQKDGPEAGYKRVREEQQSLLDKVEQLENNFEAEEARVLRERTEELTHSVEATQWSLIAGCLLSIALVSAFNIFFGRHIVLCIRKLLNAAENAENGRFNACRIDSNDEFGELGEAFNQLNLTLDAMNRKMQSMERDSVRLSDVRPMFIPLEQSAKMNIDLASFAGDVRDPVESAIQKTGSVFRCTSEVRRLQNTTNENLGSLKSSIEECSEQADRLSGLQSELDNISNALEVISMSVDMSGPDGNPVLATVMTRLHELSERCHTQRQVVGESVNRMQTLLSRAMLTTHASAGAETTGRKLLEGVTETLDSLTRELEGCRKTADLVQESISTQAEMLATCKVVMKKFGESHPQQQDQIVKKMQESLQETVLNSALG